MTKKTRNMKKLVLFMILNKNIKNGNRQRKAGHEEAEFAAG